VFEGVIIVESLFGRSDVLTGFGSSWCSHAYSVHKADANFWHYFLDCRWLQSSRCRIQRILYARFSSDERPQDDMYAFLICSLSIITQLVISCKCLPGENTCGYFRRKRGMECRPTFRSRSPEPELTASRDRELFDRLDDGQQQHSCSRVRREATHQGSRKA
jgi:hypothetical protein